jgi:diguanylate cyclase (GGDEF)-like protein
LYLDQIMTCVEIGKALTSTFNMEEILVTTVRRLSELVPASNWSLLLADPRSRDLGFEVVVGLDPSSVAHVRIPWGEGIAGIVAATGEPILVEDVRRDPRFSARVDGLTGFQTRSIICLPLKIQNAVIGVVEIVNPQDPVLFQKRSMMALSILADYLAIAIGNAMNYRKIAALTLTDTVTGFYNTRFLHQHLDALLNPPQGSPPTVSLVFLDMDNFKQVVDVHGHLLGSKVLKEVAEVIATQLREEDRLVHYGGDEFVLLLQGMGKLEAMEKVQAVRRAITDAVFLQGDGRRVKVTASFGIANYPEDAGDKAELLRLADQSMFRSKESGKDTITVR